MATQVFADVFGIRPNLRKLPAVQRLTGTFGTGGLGTGFAAAGAGAGERSDIASSSIAITSSLGATSGVTFEAPPFASRTAGSGHSRDEGLAGTSESSHAAPGAG